MPEGGAGGRDAALDRRLAVAPMLGYTDRHFRVVLRRLTRRTLLYSEMVTTGALVHGDRAAHLDYSPEERPLALQVAGDDPRDLGLCARLAEDWGYDEVSLNCGCPSERVGRAGWGAFLMRRPELVAECVAAMRAATRLPVTVKHRLGVDGRAGLEDLLAFVDTVAAAGPAAFIVHARPADLAGAGTERNLSWPPRPELVRALKRERPQLAIVLNGGIDSVARALAELDGVDGVMIGRAALARPWLLAEADSAVFGDPPRPLTPEAVLRGLVPYVEAECRRGTRLFAIARHLLPLVHGQPGARAFRRQLGREGLRPGAGAEVLVQALEGDWQRGLPDESRLLGEATTSGEGRLG